MKKLLSLIAFVTLTLATFSACSKDEEEPVEISQRKYEILAGDKTPVIGSGLNGLEWQTNNKFVAEVNSENYITAYRIGKTEIIPGQGNGYIRVTVNPKVTIYSEPLLHPSDVWNGTRFVDENEYESNQYMWGMGRSAVRLFVSRTGVNWESATSDNMLAYKTNNPATPYIVYLFDNDRLVATGIYMNPLYSSRLSDFIAERFIVYSMNLSNYTADFAHLSIDRDDEMKLHYIGRMGYSSQSNFVNIMYYWDESNLTRSSSSNILFDKLESVGLNVADHFPN